MYLGPLGFEVHIQIIIQIGLLLIGSIYLVNLKYRKYLTTWLPQSNKIYYKKKRWNKYVCTFCKQNINKCNIILGFRYKLDKN